MSFIAKVSIIKICILFLFWLTLLDMTDLEERRRIDCEDLVVRAWVPSLRSDLTPYISQ
jgi:hypothetical protein